MDRPRYEIQPAQPEHAIWLGLNMRREDAEEIHASHGLDPMTAAHGSLIYGDTLTGLVDGEVACLFGCRGLSLMSTVGVPWLLGTPLVEHHARAFCKRNRVMIKIWLQRYETLVNWVDDRNETSKRWLQWLGFTLEDPRPYGLAQLPFRRFTMTRTTRKETSKCAGH